jgi:hypothetical protein
MLHRHSTLFGIGATIVVIVIVGEASHWSAILTTLTGLIAIAIFPRFFYGFAAARAVYRERVWVPSHYFRNLRDMWNASPSEEERLEGAIAAAQGYGPKIGPDTGALAELSREENS